MMIVLNHCGITNTVYYSSHFPQPYGIPSEVDAKILVDYQPAAVDFANFNTAVQYTVDQCKGTQELYLWQDAYAQINTILHVVTIQDRMCGKIMVMFYGWSEWRNWAIVYLPASIYEATDGVFNGIESDAPRYRQGYDHQPDIRFSRGPYCWQVYFGCNFCRAYTSQPWLWKYRFTEADAINGCQEFYYVSSPNVKCSECGKVSSNITSLRPLEKLGESDIFISCWFDRC